MLSAEMIKNAESINETRKQTLLSVKNIIIDRLNLGIKADSIDDDSPLFGMGLGLDSIDSLELVVGIEEDFDVTIPEENLEVFLSINTLVDFILDFSISKPVEVNEMDNVEFPWLPSYKALRGGLLLYRKSPIVLEIPEQDGGMDFVSNLVAGNDIILESNSAMHALILNDEGGVIDLINIMMFDDKFWLLPNIHKPESALWIIEKAKEQSIDIQDISDEYCQLVCEGPYSWQMVKPFAGFEVVGLSYLHFMELEWEGENIIIFRSGTSNEYGFRMFVSKNKEELLLQTLKDKCGDVDYYHEKNNELIETTLKIASQEVRFPTLDATVLGGTSLISNELRWMIDTNKEDFIGKKSIIEEMHDYTSRIVAFIVKEETEINKEEDYYIGSPIQIADKNIGKILIFQYSPSLQKWFGYADLEKDYAFASNCFYTIEDQKTGKTISIETSSTPLFLTKSAQVVME